MTRFLRENYHTVLFGACALAVIVYEITEKFQGENLDDHWLLIFATNLLALLALVILVERVLESSSKRELGVFSEEMRILTREMQKAVGILFIEGQRKIFAKVGALFSEAQNTIKLLVVEVAAPAPESFGEDLAKFLAEHPGVMCDVTIAISKPDEAFWKANDRRLEIYERRGLIGKQFFLQVVEVSQPIVGFNVAVVDAKHCFIGFPPIPAAGQTAEAALIFDNKQKIAEKLAKWLDKIPGKRPYSEARPVK